MFLSDVRMFQTSCVWKQDALTFSNEFMLMSQMYFLHLFSDLETAQSLKCSPFILHLKNPKIHCWDHNKALHLPFFLFGMLQTLLSKVSYSALNVIPYFWEFKPTTFKLLTLYQLSTLISEALLFAAIYIYNNIAYHCIAIHILVTIIFLFDLLRC